MAMTASEIITLLEKSLQYTPIVYKQSIFSTNQEEFLNEYTLEFKQTDIPDDSLLFFVPSVSSNDSGNCKLIIKVPHANSDGSFTYGSLTYDIIVEQYDEQPRKAGKGDIIANRMCIFRFRKITGQVILCNSPLYNDAIFSNLRVTNLTLLNKPVYVDPQNPTITYTLVSTKELIALEERVAALEKKFIFGVEDAEEALADSPAGTVYIKIEED